MLYIEIEVFLELGICDLESYVFVHGKHGFQFRAHLFLEVVAQDENNKILPIAFVVVEGEIVET